MMQLKKLLLIFFLGILFSCSTEEDPEPPEPESEAKYFIYLNEDCMLGVEGADRFQVTEETFYSVVDNSEALDCDYYTIPDVEGTVYEGYYVGNEKHGS